MAPKKPATLAAALVAVKGAAVPARAVGAVEPYYKSLTVKLTRQRFEAIKTRGLDSDQSSQTIFVEALDLWLARPARAGA